MAAAERTIQERAQDYYNLVFDDDLQHLMQLAESETEPTDEDQADGLHTCDDAFQRIAESNYGVSRETVYYITIAGGGPAARIRVVPDEDGEVEEASLQFCDWFESWTDAPRQDSELVARYARLMVGYFD